MEKITQIVQVVMDTWHIWAPAIAAIGGVVIACLNAISRVKTAVDEFKDDRTIKDTNQKLSELLERNKELVKTNKILIDEIKRIKGYADEVEK